MCLNKISKGEILRVEYPDGDFFVGEVVAFGCNLGKVIVLRDLETGLEWPAFESTKLTKLLAA